MAKSAGTNGLDIQRDYICVAQFSSRDSAVRQVAVQPLPVGADAGGDVFWDAVAQELRGVKKKIRFAGADVVCSMPCDMAVVKTLEAESDERDQDEILRWELEASLLGPIGDYAYDFYEVDPGNQVERRKYLAAAVRQESLAKLRKAVRGAGLNPYIVDIDLFALTSAFQSNYRERLGEASVLAHGELKRTKMILVNNSSYINYAVAEFDAEAGGAGDYAAMLRGEAARLLDASGFSGGDGAPVYLAGSLFTDSQFVADVVEAFPRSEVFDPFRKVACEAGIDAEQLKVYAPQLAVAVGLALRGDEA
jgi:Tfp pilus assembly PilM family ATPase